MEVQYHSLTAIGFTVSTRLNNDKRYVSTKDNDGFVDLMTKRVDQKNNNNCETGDSSYYMTTVASVMIHVTCFVFVLLLPYNTKTPNTMLMVNLYHHYHHPHPSSNQLILFSHDCVVYITCLSMVSNTIKYVYLGSIYSTKQSQ